MPFQPDMTLQVPVLEDQLRSMIHFTPPRPRQTTEALQPHALLIKRFVEEFIFKAYAT